MNQANLKESAAETRVISVRVVVKVGLEWEEVAEEVDEVD